MDKLDKTVPANPEAEEAVLGSLLIDPDAVLKVASFLEAEDFYRERNGWIYRAILDLHERREPADFVTLCDELERRNILSGDRRRRLHHAADQQRAVRGLRGALRAHRRADRHVAPA